MNRDEYPPYTFVSVCFFTKYLLQVRVNENRLYRGHVPGPPAKNEKKIFSMPWKIFFIKVIKTIEYCHPWSG